MFCVCRCDHSLSGPADHACFVCAGVIMFCVCRCDHSLSSPPDHDCMLSVLAVHQTMTVLCAQM